MRNGMLLKDAPANPSPKSRPRRSTALTQALEIQELMFKDIVNPETKPSIRAGIARAWCDVEECKRVLRGKPLPGQLRPDLNPAALLKQLKRARKCDMLPTIEIGPAFEVTEPVKERASERPIQPQAPPTTDATEPTDETPG
jgi:hypothetical protein